MTNEYNETEDYILHNIDVIRFKTRIEMLTEQDICAGNYQELTKPK